MYAVINDRSRQFSVKAGDEILCDLGADLKPGEDIQFSQVHLVGQEGQVRVGKPYVEGASVSGQVLGPARGPKVVFFRFKRRKNVRKKKGHRQTYARVRISAINA